MGVGEGVGVGAGEGMGVGAGEGSTLGDGCGVGLGSGMGVGSADGVGSGVGVGSTAGDPDGSTASAANAMIPEDPTGNHVKSAATSVATARTDPARRPNRRRAGFFSTMSLSFKPSVSRGLLLAGCRAGQQGARYGSKGSGVGPLSAPSGIVPVGSWQAWQVPRLSILSRLLSATAGTDPSGYGAVAE